MDGIRLSGAERHYYRHNDLEDLEEKLRKYSSSNNWIVTESVFSMDGDIAPLNEICTLAEKYGALVYVDEAHRHRSLEWGAGPSDSRKAPRKSRCLCISMWERPLV